AFPHLLLHLTRDAAIPRAARRELLLLERRDQEIERLCEDRLELPPWILVAHEGASLLELRPERLACGALEEVALRGRRQHSIVHLLQHVLRRLDHAVRPIRARAAERDQYLDLGAGLVGRRGDPVVDRLFG